MDLKAIQQHEELTRLRLTVQTMKARIHGLEAEVERERNRANSNSGHFRRLKAEVALKEEG
jgi:hypothetical protein